MAGASGLKLHEDWGTTPAAIDCCLDVSDSYDVPVAIHTDTLNEAGFVEDTIAAIAGRTIHTYHTEGAGGGHAPDIIRMAGELNVLPSSTNPTRPYTVNTLAEHMDMLMVCHHLSPNIPEDVAFAESRIRPETMAAEDVLHDLGVLSIYSSDSQAMGRVGENFTRLFQTADKMLKFKGKLPEDAGEHDNFRVLRYLAKLTINPAIAHGISHVVGSLTPGKMADIVLWPINSFGAKPKMVIKGGMVNWALMGDPNGSIPTVEPTFYRPMFGAHPPLGRNDGVGLESPKVIGGAMFGRKAFLTALRLSDSFFPTGMYAHYHGLEPMAARGLVATPADVERFLTSQLTWSVLPSDGVALLNSHAAAEAGDLERLRRIDQLLWALKLPAELRAASTQLGWRLLAETGPFPDCPIHGKFAGLVTERESPGNGAVALGVIAEANEIPAEEAVLVLCHSHSVSVLGAAMRLLPMSHTDCQAILGRLYTGLAEALDDIEGTPWEPMTSFSPNLDIASMGHETII